MSNTSNAQLEFELAKDNLEEAVNRFDVAAEQLIKVESERTKEVLKESKKMRKTINRLVCHLAKQSYANDFRAAWIDTYKVMGRIFKYNPASKQTSHTQPHLDICEQDGKLPELLKIVQAMIASEAADAR